MIPIPTYKFPHDPALVQLLTIARQTPAADIVIEDSALNCQKTYPELLADIVATRELLRAQLPQSALDAKGLLCDKRQNIVLLAKSGYEFLVSFFAIRSLGGVCAPLGTGVLPEEADYFLLMTNSISILADRGSMERADNIRAYVKQTRSEFLTVVPISCDAQPLFEAEGAIEIDHTCIMAPDGAGLIMFTSGTTGRPKGVVLPRCSLLGTGAREPGSVALVYRPNHWLGGARHIIQSLLSGRKLHSLKTKVQDARAQDVLRAFRTSSITHVAFMPDVLQRMMFLLTCHRDQSTIPQGEGSMAQLFQRIVDNQMFWRITQIIKLGGLAIGGASQRYGSMGTPAPGIKVKLSEGDRGELCVKSLKMLLRYLGDSHTIENTFDKEGYYKTGDLAKYIDGEYIFSGRVATDCVQYAAFRFSTLAVEDSLAKLPYILETCVVAVPHKKLRQLCAAVVRLRPDARIPRKISTLGLIRSDLEGKLPMYMMPTLLRVLKDEEELPCTIAGKPTKREVLRLYFGSVNGAQVDSYPPGVECCPIPKPGEATKPWDWDGRQFEH